MAGEICPELKDICVDTLKPAVSRFFGALTDSQWANLRCDGADSETKCQLVELLCDVAELYTGAVLLNVQARHLTLEDVAAGMGHAVPETFAEVLGVRDGVPSHSSEAFNKSVVSHVFNRIRCCFCSDPDDLTEAYVQQISDFYNVSSMVCQGVVMIRELVIAGDGSRPESTVKEFIPPQAWDYAGTNLRCVDTEQTPPREVALTDSQIIWTLDGGQTEQGKSLRSVPTEEKSQQKPKRKGAMRSIKRFFSKHILKRSVPPPGPLVEDAAAEKLPKVTREIFDTDRKSNLDVDVGEWGERVGSVESLEDDGSGECIRVKDYAPQKQFMRLTYIEDIPSDDDLSETRPEETETQHRFTDEVMPEVEGSADRSVETFRSERLSGPMNVKRYDPQPLITSSPEDVFQDGLLDDLALEESEEEIPENPPGEPQRFCVKSRECVVARENLKTENPLPFSYTTPVEVFVLETERSEGTPANVQAPEEELNQGEDLTSGDMTYVNLLVGALMTRAIKDSQLIFSLEGCQLVHKRLFDRICATLGSRDVPAGPDSLLELNAKLFKSLCKKLCCSEGVLLSVMSLNCPGTDDEIVSCFVKTVRKVQNKPRSVKQALRDLGRNIRELILKKRGAAKRVQTVTTKQDT